MHGPHGPTLGLQAVLEADRRNWQGIWERSKDSASAPWRTIDLDLPWAPDLPEIAATRTSLEWRLRTSGALALEWTQCIRGGWPAKPMTRSALVIDEPKPSPTQPSAPTVATTSILMDVAEAGELGVSSTQCIV